jgi:hypothetical protein
MVGLVFRCVCLREWRGKSGALFDCAGKKKGGRTLVKSGRVFEKWEFEGLTVLIKAETLFVFLARVCFRAVVNSGGS